MDHLPFNGNKTYLLATVGGVVVFLHILGLIDQTMMMYFMEILGVGSVFTLRHAIKKNE